MITRSLGPPGAYPRRRPGGWPPRNVGERPRLVRFGGGPEVSPGPRVGGPLSRPVDEASGRAPTKERPHMNAGLHDRSGDGRRDPGSGQAGPGVAAPPSAEPTSGAVAVEVADLVKRYPKAPVDSLAGVTFQVRPGRGLRLPRPQRRRQDHHDRDPDHPDPTHRRAGPGRRRRRGRRSGGGTATARRGTADQQPGPLAVGTAEPAVPRQLPRGAGRRSGKGGPTLCSSSSGSPIGREAGPMTSPEARSSG